MHVQSNRNVNSSSAHAEKSYSTGTPPSASQTAETPPPDVKGPGLPDCEFILNTSIENKKENEKEKNWENSEQFDEFEKFLETVSVDTQIEASNTSPDVGNDLPNFDARIEAGVEEESETDDFSDEEMGGTTVNCENGGKKSEGPGSVKPFVEIEIPNVLLIDMKECVKAMEKMKFNKLDNCATRLISKFKKSLPCPKCRKIHGFTSQGTKSSQWGGTSPDTCRASSQQILMNLPNSLITDISNRHKAMSVEDASLFSAWIASSKSQQKKGILQNLRNQMEVEHVADASLEKEEGEINLVADPEDEIVSETQKMNLYSDAEFRAAATDEMLTMRKRIAQLEGENDLLRRENAVLKRFNSEPAIKPLKLKTEIALMKGNESFAEVAKAYTPKVTILKRSRQDTGPASGIAAQPKIKPIVNLDSFTTSPDRKESKFEKSNLCFVYFKGLLRRQQSQYRALFDQIGFESFKARDIQFLSKDVVQILTYENCVDDLVEKIQKSLPTVTHLKDADPTDPKLYSDHGVLSKDFLTAQYYVSMELAVERFKKLIEKQPVLTRCLHFLQKVVETKNTRYAQAPAKPKMFLMNSFISLDQIKPSPPQVVVNNSADMEISPTTEEPAVDSKASMETSQ